MSPKDCLVNLTFSYDFIRSINHYFVTLTEKRPALDSPAHPSNENTEKCNRLKEEMEEFAGFEPAEDDRGKIVCKIEYRFTACVKHAASVTAHYGSPSTSLY